MLNATSFSDNNMSLTKVSEQPETVVEKIFSDSTVAVTSDKGMLSSCTNVKYAGYSI